MLPTRRPLEQPPDEADPIAAEFRASYKANYREVRRYVGRLSGSPFAADDMTQEAFVRLWCELSSGTQIQNPRAWLYKVAGRIVLSRARTLQRRRHLDGGGGESPDEIRSGASSPETKTTERDLVRRALVQLPTPMRQCLLLYHAGLTGKEIAAALDVKPSYVGTMVMRGHERFRRECAALGVLHPFGRE